jgi:hypothetical protein
MMSRDSPKDEGGKESDPGERRDDSEHVLMPGRAGRSIEQSAH